MGSEEGSTKKKLNNLHSSPIIVWVIKYRLRWSDHVAGIVKGRSAFKILTGTPAGKRLLGRPRVGGWSILEWILKK